MNVSLRDAASCLVLIWLAAGCAGDPAQSDREPWNETSAHVSLRSFGYWEGSSRFEADREQLTDAQLSALAGLRQIPTPKGLLGADFVSYRVDITDAEGTVAHYRAAQDNITDSDEPDLTLHTLDVDSLAPFLDSFHCLTARGNLFGGAAPAEDATAADANAAPRPDATTGLVPRNWANAPAVSTEAQGCFHGVFVSSGCDDVWLDLQVAAPGKYQLSSEGCFESLELAVFSSDGTAQLSSAAGGRDACPVVEQSFAAAGSYPLLLRKTNAAGCSAQGGAGDFYFHVAADTRR